MAGISAINSINYASSINWSIGSTKRKLTAATKARLHALGIDTTNIRTEEEGQEALRTASFRRENITTFAKQENGNSLVREMEEQIKLLLYDLGLSIDPNEDFYHIIYRMKNRINELKVSAGDDKSKLSKITDFNSRVAYVENMHKSQIDLGATMSITANMNLGYHRLF